MVNPKISIIVPIYKVEQYLSRCIDSILNQTFQDFELILVNDGSPDNCGQICEAYALKDERIKVIHKENGGLSDARNAGLDLCSGEYIGFIDSDDFIHPRMYERLYNVLRKSEALIAQCDFQYFKNIEEISQNAVTNEFKIYDYKEAIAGLIDNHLLVANVWNKLYHKSLFGNIRFPKGKIHEDEYVTYKLFYYAKKIARVEDKLYFYYNNSNGIMKNLNIEHKIHWIQAIEERGEFLKINQEEYLYDKSNIDLFFNLLKTRYLLQSTEKSKRDHYLNDINSKILYVLGEIQNNNLIGKPHQYIIRLANVHLGFLKIYDLNNFVLSKKYKFNHYRDVRRK